MTANRRKTMRRLLRKRPTMVAMDTQTAPAQTLFPRSALALAMAQLLPVVAMTPPAPPAPKSDETAATAETALEPLQQTPEGEAMAQKEKTAQAISETQESPIAPTKRELSAAVTRTVGERMREARIDFWLGRDEAAHRLGVDAKYLRKLEEVQDIINVSFVIVFQAARLYCVTTDWLCGLTEDTDGDKTATQIAACLADQWEAQRRENIVMFLDFHRRQTEVEEALRPLCDLAKEAGEALAAIRVKNPAGENGEGGWEDIRGGARMESVTARLTQAVAAAEVARAHARKLSRSAEAEAA